MRMRWSCCADHVRIMCGSCVDQVWIKCGSRVDQVGYKAVIAQNSQVQSGQISSHTTAQTHLTPNVLLECGTRRPSNVDFSIKDGDDDQTLCQSVHVGAHDVGGIGSSERPADIARCIANVRTHRVRSSFLIKFQGLPRSQYLPVISVSIPFQSKIWSRKVSLVVKALDEQVPPTLSRHRATSDRKHW